MHAPTRRRNKATRKFGPTRNHQIVYYKMLRCCAEEPKHATFREKLLGKTLVNKPERPEDWISDDEDTPLKDELD